MCTGARLCISTHNCSVLCECLSALTQLYTLPFHFHFLQQMMPHRQQPHRLHRKP